MQDKHPIASMLLGLANRTTAADGVVGAICESCIAVL